MGGVGEGLSGYVYACSERAGEMDDVEDVGEISKERLRLNPIFSF